MDRQLASASLMTLVSSSPPPAAVVLVEGVSDQVALETLAERRGRDLRGERVAILPIGGATNIGHFLALLTAPGPDVVIAGLCDVGEEGAFRRGLQNVGLGSNLDRVGMEALGFYVCVVDLEDELIRALGARTVVEIIEDEGELGSFQRFQNQPAQRARPIGHQLRRFMGTRSGRKVHYARQLVVALDPEVVPHPLDGVMSQI